MIWDAETDTAGFFSFQLGITDMQKYETDSMAASQQRLSELRLEHFFQKKLIVLGESISIKIDFVYRIICRAIISGIRMTLVFWFAKQITSFRNM